MGAGFALASATADYGVWLLGFGVLAGTGIGFGYASATPPALKWFPPSRTGLVAGIVVAGFGLAPVYLAPVTQHLLGVHGVRTTMLVLGVAFTAIVCGLAQFLVNPPSARDAATAAPLAAVGSRPRDILRTRAFWVLWAVFFVGAGAGLMVISSVSGMAKKSMGSLSFVAVAVMAVGNAGGRVVAGLLSDRIGRRRTLLAVLLFQAALMAAAIPVTGAREGAPVLVVLVASLIGFNYGANLSLFPAFAKDLWGLQGFGLNYGVLFSAWGVGGLVLSRLGQTLTARSHGSYESSLVTACVLLLAAAALTLLIRSRPAAAPVKAGTGGAPTHPAAPAAPPSGAGRRVA